MEPFPERHPISRARFFLQRAEECAADERDAFESYLEASIVFGRSAIQWLMTKYRAHPDWQEWFNGLAADSAITFFKYYRDDIIHERPPKIHQIVKAGSINAGGSEPVEQVTRATELYYFEAPEISATETVRRHLETTTKYVVYAEEHFAESPGSLP